jgi:hypothetical protein
VGDGKRDVEDRTQPDRSECGQFLRLCLAGSPAVTQPCSQRWRRAFSFSIELDGRDGRFCRVGYCDFRPAVAEPAEAKEVI